jgi:hypothetical protein
MKNIMSRIAGKTIMFALVALVPFFAGAATLSNSFNIGTLVPTAGGTTYVSSSCGVAGANSTVSFALVQNGVVTAMTTNLSTDSNGNFSGNVTFPSPFNSGSATLVATCNRTGDTINSPFLTFAAPAIGSFGLPAVSPNVGGIYNISGACGNSINGSSADIILHSNGANYPLGSFSLNSAGTFAGSVVIPANVASGAANLSATCSNGTTFSSNIMIDPSAVDSFAFSSSPFPGGTTTISGNCTNVSGNANGSVNFTVLRNGAVSTLPTANNTTNQSGYFSSQVTFPTSVGSDPATLVVTCPNGSTFSNVIMLGATVFAADPVTTTPVGGVAAGSGPQDNQNYSVFGEILLVSGLVGLLAVTGKKFFYVKK